MLMDIGKFGNDLTDISDVYRNKIGWIREPR